MITFCVPVVVNMSNLFLLMQAGVIVCIRFCWSSSRSVLGGSMASQTDPPRQYLWVFYHFRSPLKAYLHSYYVSCRLVVFCDLAFSRGCFETIQLRAGVHHFTFSPPNARSSSSPSRVGDIAGGMTRLCPSEVCASNRSVCVV